MNIMIRVAVISFFFLMSASVCIMPHNTAFSADLAKATIEQARQDLRVSLFSYNNAAAQFEQLASSSSASPELIEMYQSYLSRLKEILDESRNIVSEMEKMYTAARPAKQFEQPGFSATQNIKNEINEETQRLPQEHIYDDLATLEEELNQSVSEFDEMLLIEDAELAARLEAIRANSAGKLQDLAEEAQMAEEEIRIQTASQQASTGVASGEESSQQAPEEGGFSGKEIKKNGNSDTGLAQPGIGGKIERQQQRQVEYDEDIVARQLREAAEKETDPELKEKLWQEYEAYKKNSTYEQ